MTTKESSRNWDELVFQLQESEHDNECLRAEIERLNNTNTPKENSTMHQPAEVSTISTIIPPEITMYEGTEQVYKLEFKEGKVIGKGDADAGAKAFFDAFAKIYQREYLALKERAEKAEQELTLYRSQCPECRGIGNHAGQAAITCTACNGTGKSTKGK